VRLRQPGKASGRKKLASLCSKRKTGTEQKSTRLQNLYRRIRLPSWGKYRDLQQRTCKGKSREATKRDRGGGGPVLAGSDLRGLPILPPLETSTNQRAPTVGKTPRRKNVEEKVSGKNKTWKTNNSVTREGEGSIAAREAGRARRGLTSTDGNEGEPHSAKRRGPDAGLGPPDATTWIREKTKCPA